MIQPGQMSPSYSSPGGMSQSTLNRMQDEAGSSEFPHPFAPDPRTLTNDGPVTETQ